MGEGITVILTKSKSLELEESKKTRSPSWYSHFKCSGEIGKHCLEEKKKEV